MDERIIENRKKWIEALRSGEYTQGREALRVSLIRDFDQGNREVEEDFYCCLGVAADIFIQNKQNVEEVCWREEYEYPFVESGDDKHMFDDYNMDIHHASCVSVILDGHSSIGYLPLAIYEYYGLSQEGMFDLGKANDIHKLNFDEIADLIENDTKLKEKQE